MSAMQTPGPRTIAVTGATRGLGRALVDRFLEGGHRVMACGRSPEHVAELNALAGEDRIFAQQVDVTNEADVTAWADEGRVRDFLPDLVIANAGRVICAAVESAGGRKRDAMRAIEEKVRANTAEMLERAERDQVPPRAAAVQMARERVDAAMAYTRFH